jgi:hypothetical protein
MRLLDTTELVFREYFDEPPPYAILSHTWDYGQEVSFQDMLYLSTSISMQGGITPAAAKIRSKTGYSKIVVCCQKAREAEIGLCWVDTCCINKDSSSELSEAINSMYHYYANSKVCYVYLGDLVSGRSLDTNDDDGGYDSVEFRSCRWLKRGWTLQELIAPSDLIFYNQSWSIVGKLARFEALDSSLSQRLADATGIDVGLLTGVKQLEDFSIAQKLSWAALRSTSRIEDESYCLLGILGVNLPLLYGERDRAFFRLQKELLESTDDETLFAWSTQQNSGDPRKFGGFLATSPKAFANAGNIVRARLALPTHSPYHWTNRGLRITLNMDTRFGSPAVGAAVAVLDCVSYDSPRQPLGILVSILDVADTARIMKSASGESYTNKKLSSSQENFNVYRYLRAPSPVPLAAFKSKNEMAEYLVPVLVHVPQHLSAKYAATLQQRAIQHGTVEDFSPSIRVITIITVLFLPITFVSTTFGLERDLGVPYHLFVTLLAIATVAVVLLPRDSVVIRTATDIWNALLRQR